MRVATLITWLLTASLGGFMLRTWIARGGLRRERARTGGLPPQLIFGHATLAITGLLLWGGFMASGARGLAWAAIACVMVAVGLGLSTVTLWTPYPTVYPPAREEPAPVTAGRIESEYQVTDEEYQVTDEMIARLLADPFPERRRAIQPNMAVLVPIAHGCLAIATFVLAVTAASMA